MVISDEWGMVYYCYTNIMEVCKNKTGILWPLPPLPDSVVLLLRHALPVKILRMQISCCEENTLSY